jgi:hypothetical protein
MEHINCSVSDGGLVVGRRELLQRTSNWMIWISESELASQRVLDRLSVCHFSCLAKQTS